MRFRCRTHSRQKNWGLEADECRRENGLPVTAQMPSKDTWVAQEVQAMTDSQADPPPLPLDGLLQRQYEDVCHGFPAKTSSIE
ncbi:hypothetical protein GCM10009583_15420 [Ornithinicoccus hortensis]